MTFGALLCLIQGVLPETIIGYRVVSTDRKDVDLSETLSVISDRLKGLKILLLRTRFE